jgi:hypothetical protein
MNIPVDVALPAPVAVEVGADELNKWLGRREAFSMVAGRCSAADVECMRAVRDRKLYLSRSPDWKTFCADVLHMSKSNVNHLIGLLEKFGPEYFHLAQITRISVAEYRAIAPAVSARGIEANDELIPLHPEHGERIAAAVSALRKARRARTEPSFEERLAALDAAGGRWLRQVGQLAEGRGRGDPYIDSLLEAVSRKLGKLRAEVG